MKAEDPAWQRFLDAAPLGDVMGGVAGAEFEGLGPLGAEGPGPREVAIGSFTFFPASANEETPPPKDGFLLAQSETRALIVSGDGTLSEVHYGGRRPLPFTLGELIDLAAPFVALPIENVSTSHFLSPSREASMRAALGAKFDTAADLFGVPLLAGARAELESRITGSRALLWVALFLLLGVFLVAGAVDGLALMLGVVAVLGCIPATLIVLGLRNGSKAKRELQQLPRP